MLHQKRSLRDLAVFGGHPSFHEPLHVGKPHLVDRQYFLDEVNKILDREYYTNNGPVLVRFEKYLVSLTGVKHCIAVCNGTKALEISARALGLSGEVIVPAFTFIAAPHALYWQGIKPVFCDIEPNNHQIDPSKIENLITSRTSAILAVHLWGSPCDVEALEGIAKKHNLKLLFDASHSFGATHLGRRVGCFGDAEAVSFHATKMINTFEGGAILTNNDMLAEKSRLMINFGFTDYDEVSCIGTNGKLSEVHSAMGLTCLRHIDSVLSTNKKKYMHYKSLIKDIDGVRLVPQFAGSNHQYVVIEITRGSSDARDLLYAVLQHEGILARRYFYPGCHNMEPYRTHCSHPFLPVTDSVASKVLVLPTGPSVSNTDIDRVVSLIKFTLDNINDIQALMKQL